MIFIHVQSEAGAKRVLRNPESPCHPVIRTIELRFEVTAFRHLIKT
jgi:hypothetical protein